MSSEPPFEHPPDHSRYGMPPEPPRSLPWMLTPSFKTGCAFLCLSLLTMCCFSAVIDAAKNAIVQAIQEVGHRLDETNKKLDEVNKKLDEKEF